jgi:hypothetical protein
MFNKIINSQNTIILDVGAGEGKWGKLLKDQVSRIDALEVWMQYIVNFELNKYYDNVTKDLVESFKDFSIYDIVILGDVLEHLKYFDAVKLINKLKKEVKQIYLTIPISDCPQDGEILGNPFETHLYQWKDKELQELGFIKLHEGWNEAKIVLIGTYVLYCDKYENIDN